MNAMLNLRPTRPDDEPFLRGLRAQVDAERLALHHWSADSDSVQLAQKIINFQFQAHAAHYRTVKNNWDTKDCVIEMNGRLVGRFILTQDAQVVYLSDIAIDANFRGQGLGQAVIEAMKHECTQSKRVLHLHVDRANAALQFYLNLGFQPIAENPVQLMLEWVPPTLIGKTMVFGPE